MCLYDEVKGTTQPAGSWQKHEDKRVSYYHGKKSFHYTTLINL